MSADNGGTRLPARLLEAFRDVLGLDERRCAVCHAPFASGTSREPALCADCRPLLPRYTAAKCPLCGVPAAFPDAPSLPCGDCLTEPPPWGAVVYHGLYGGLLQTLLLRLKFGGDFSIARLLGTLLADACADLPPVDAVTPLPQHPARLRARGFNQALELARVITASLRAPLRPDLLRRTVDRPPQEHLNARRRRENPRGSFAAVPVRGLQLLLVDDTMTTGSTVRHAVLTLRQAGADAVHVAVAARTPPPGYAAQGEKT